MDKTEHLYDLIEGFGTAMLVTCKSGGLHARPMAVAQIEHGADAYFATSIDSPKVAEIEADPHVLLTFQSNAKFASVDGEAAVVRDRALIDKLWSSEWKMWFPRGQGRSFPMHPQGAPEVGRVLGQQRRQGHEISVRRCQGRFARPQA